MIGSKNKITSLVLLTQVAESKCLSLYYLRSDQVIISPDEAHLRSEGVIPRWRNSLRETIYAKYKWLYMNNSIEFSPRKNFASPLSSNLFYSLRGGKK